MALNGVFGHDTTTTRHSGAGPSNTSVGSSRQIKNTICGGSGNIQYNATNQYFNDARVPNQVQLDADFRRLLFVTSPEIDRNNLIDIKEHRVANTCEWIRTAKEYEAFRSGTQRLLWIWGEPGKGKTVLSIFISQELELKREAKTIYFFCMAEHDKRNTATAVLRGLLWQLTGICPELTRVLRASCGAVAEDAFSSRETLWARFKELVAAVQTERLYCVIDALDECDESSRQWLAKRFLSLQSDGNTRSFSVIILSRYLVELKNTYQVDLNSSYNKQVETDVRTFVKIKTEELFGRISFDAARCNEIRNKLSWGAQGSFLWVGFAMIDLLKQKSESGVMNALGRLPAGLFPLYDRMLRDFEPDQREVGLCVLRFVALACRPLTLADIAFVVSCYWSESAPSVTEKDVRSIVEGCGPLLRIKGETLALAHESARDYTKQAVFPDGLGLESQDTHLRFARACINALSQETQRNPFVKYAAQFWPHHARGSGTLAEELISHPSCFFKTSSELRTEWWKKFRKSYCFSTFNDAGNDDIPRLHMACFLGIKPWAEDILKVRNAGFLEQFSVGRNARYLEQFLVGRHHIVQRDHNFRTALHWATVGGQEAVVKFLLDRQTNPDAEDCHGKTALYYAAREGHDMVAKLLLDHKANMDAGFGEITALQLAASRGHKAVAKLLLDHKADANAAGRYGTALYIAVSNDHEAIARLLLENKANVEARCREGTVLHLAALNGHEAIVKLLLDYRMSVDARRRDDCKAETASLDDRKADARSRDSREADAGSRVSPKAPQTAVLTTHKAIPWLRLVINARRAKVLAGVDVGTGSDGNTEVNAEIEANVELGANSVVMGPLGGTALHCAALQGHQAIAKLLLDYKANVHIQDSHGETALHFAAWRGDAAMAEMFIDRKANVNARKNNGRTALHFAANSEATIELLLEHGADPDAKDDSDRTALHDAAGGKAEAAAKLLLGYGADPHATDDRGWTVLHHAVDKSYPRVSYSQLISTVETLLDHQVDINAQDREGKTALSRVLERYHDTGSWSEEEDVGKTKERNQLRAFMRILIDHGARSDAESAEGGHIQRAILEAD